MRAPTCATSCSTSAYMAETLETSHDLEPPHRALRAVRSAIDDALSSQGTPGLVMCHLSHAYPDGASLYFTFLARAQAGRRARAVAGGQAAACEAIVEAGGRSPITTRSAATTLPYMRAEIGELGIEALRAVKERLDPAGIMNPGKLIPDAKG